MAPTIEQVKSGINDFLDAIQEAAEQTIQDQNIPLIGDIATTAGAAMFAALKSTIGDAISSAGDLEEVATILDALDELEAHVENGELHLTFVAGGKTDLVAPNDFSLGAQVGAGVGFNLDGTFSATLNTAMEINVVIDDGGVHVVDSGNAELRVWVDGNLSLNEAGGSLGFLEIKASDRDPNAPEVHVEATIDLPSFDIVDLATAIDAIDIGFGGSAGLDLKIDIIGGSLIPSMSMNLLLSLGFDDDLALDAPTIKFNQISIDAVSTFGIFAEALASFADILDTEPMGTFFDLMTGPVPLIDDLAHSLDIVSFFDVMPGILPDKVISLLDLAVLKDQAQGQEANHFYDMLGFLALVRQVGGSIDEDGKIVLGDLDFSAAANPTELLSKFTKAAGFGQDLFNDALNAIDDVPILADIKDKLEGAFTTSTGLEIPMLDDPTLIIKFLFNSLYGGEDVDIVRFNIPDLDLKARADIFFSILGPLGLTLKGEVNGHMDFTVGYDTAGLRAVMAGGSGAELLDGFYFAANKNNAPIDPDSNPTGYDPIGHLDGRIGAGAAFRGFIINASVTGGIGFGLPERAINAWLADDDGDGKTRIDDLENCFLIANGAVVADVLAELEVGFDPFSYTKRISLIDTVLADFDLVKCLTTVDSPDGMGLATYMAPGLALPVGFIGHDLALNTGDRAAFRVFEGGGTTSTGTDGNENIEIRFARDVIGGGPTAGTTQYSGPIAGALDITGFGITQRYGVDTSDAIPDGDQTIFAIKANLGEGNDSVVMEREITIAAAIAGGAGFDLISTGAGNDSLDGGEGDDFLIGNAGNDTLRGGNGNDQLEGGAGADLLDGGAGRDKVDYYDTATEGVIITNVGGTLVGSRGDAIGDTFISIEYFVGTRFSDILTTAPEASDQPSATLEGREGDDLLIGSDTKRDFLIGGAGADTLLGGALEDGTSYASSYGAVMIDLRNAIYYGGEADGDVLDSIEDVQGSGFDDFIVGDAGTNVIDGFVGDDVLTGYLGVDTVMGGQGNDTIYAYADGDTLDGGGPLHAPDRDLLTYELANTTGLNVNLATGVGGGGDTIVLAQRITGYEAGTNKPIYGPVANYSSFEDLTGSNGNDTLTGDYQANVIRGLNGNDTLDGGGGDDTLIGGAGADFFIGGEGMDWVDYSESDEKVKVSMFAGDVGEFGAAGDRFTDRGGSGFGLTSQLVENIRGTRFSDTIDGDNSDNIIDPGLSDSGVNGDFVSGQGGRNTLLLDYSVGPQGKGMVGGYDYGQSAQGSFARQAATTTENIDSVRFFSIQNLHIIGTALGDTIRAGSGDDVIISGDGNDSILGGTGMDVVDAGRGNDTVEYGTDLNRNALATHNPFYFQLDGGEGIDTLNIHLGGMTTGVTLVGPAGGVQTNGQNLLLANGASAHNFEILGDIDTGSGDDTLTQLGRVNNSWFTAGGQDTITPGLGSDFVNAGVETVGLTFQTTSDDVYAGVVTDAAAYYGSRGDLLVLDYSTLASGMRVESESSLVNTDITIGEFHNVGEIGDYWDYFQLQGNSAYYHTSNADGSYGGDSLNAIFHDRVDITGSDGDDVLVGSFIPYDASHLSTLKGDDVLRGGKGNDVLYGQTGDDSLYGGDGNDYLVGSVKQQPDSLDVSYDDVEVDHLWGGSGFDTFVVGEWDANFYYDAIARTTNHYVVIEDWSFGDKVQFTGSLSNYHEVIVNGVDKQILAANNDIVAYIKGGIFFNLASDGIVAPFLPIILPFAAPGAQSLALAVPESASDEAAPHVGLAAAAVAGTFKVEALSDPDLLLHKLGTPTGFTNTSLAIEGNSQAIGWFEGDPFGLGSGIVLSTGRVEDLPGPNTDAGAAPAATQEVALTFEKIGTFNNSTVYKARLDGLGIDMRSITLHDSNLRTEGGDGEVSGFDLNSIMLSSVDIPVGGSLSGINSMSRLNVFDFSALGTHLNAGDQRYDPFNSNESAPFLRGALSDTVVNNGWATLQTLDLYDSIQTGFVSLGDGGSIGFDLTQTVSTDTGPLYLYVSEADASTGETLTGIISASTEKVVPAGDLSTDLGDQGLGGDRTTLTYHFTPDADNAMVQFQVVLFSEELPEFAGMQPLDVFKATLNGVSIGTLSDGKAATLDNLMVTTYGPKHHDLVLNSPGTGPAADLLRADAYTTVLTFRGRANVGVDNVLKLEVADKGDAFLDTGVFVRALPLTGTPIARAIWVTGFGDPVEDGSNATIDVTRPADADLHSTVIVHLAPSANIGLGESGAGGAGLDVVFGPGESGTKQIVVRAIGNAGPSQPGSVEATVTSDDPGFTNPAIPRIAFDIVDTYEVPENSLDVYHLSVPGVAEDTVLTWSITGGVDAARFEINASTGELSFINAPDFEAPADTGADNDYSVFVTARNAAGAIVDTQKINARVTDVAEMSVMKVKFESARADYKNTLGWYDSRTGVGGIVFGSIDANGPSRIKKGDAATFEVATKDAPYINFFLVPNGGGRRENSSSELTGGTKVIRLANGTWAVATLDKHGNVETNKHGRPNLLMGEGAAALFSETSKNAGGVDHASSRTGRNQTAQTLAGDTADGPTGRMAWEDHVAVRKPNGTYGAPGDADYDDAVFTVTETRSVTLTGTDGADKLGGGASSDFLLGKGGNDTLNGRGGNDRLDGGQGADKMTGGRGNDVYVVDNAGDRVIESRDGGDDTVRSSISYILTAHTESLVLTGKQAINGIGNGLDNTITGNDAANVLDGKQGDDHLAGLGGDDTYIVDSSRDVVTEAVNGGNDTVRSSVSYVLGPNVETLILTGTAAINGTGNGDANTLVGNRGANILDGKGGADRMEGNRGSDTYVVDNVGDVVVEAAKSGVDTVRASISYGLGANVENLKLTGSAAIHGLGNGGANILIGNRAGNMLDGGAGADELRGLGGDDTYFVDDAGDKVFEQRNEGNDTVRSSVSFKLGDNIENLVLLGTAAINGTGNDLGNILVGNGAANVLRAGGGGDILIGGGGADRLYGGSDHSRDIFVFQAIGDSGVTSSTRDRVYDFDRNVDKLDFSDIDAGAADGDQSFRFVTSFSTGSTGQIRAVNSGSHVRVEVDLDGDNVVDMMVQVMNASNLRSADFVL